MSYKIHEHHSVDEEVKLDVQPPHLLQSSVSYSLAVGRFFFFLSQGSGCLIFGFPQNRHWPMNLDTVREWETDTWEKTDHVCSWMGSSSLLRGLLSVLHTALHITPECPVLSVKSHQIRLFLHTDTSKHSPNWTAFNWFLANYKRKCGWETSDLCNS